MIPTLNQSKCLRMLEEWKSCHPCHVSVPDLQQEDTVTLQTASGLTMGEVTNLVILAHAHGVHACLIALHNRAMEIVCQVPPSDPPSLTRLRRRAHAGRLSAKKGGE